MDHQDIYAFDRYLVRKKFFKLFGAAFHIYDETGQNVLFYSKQKAFKLKEDIRLYTGEDMETELLLIKARKVIDFGSGYEVHDSVSGEKVGSLRRKGFKSMLRDEWVILDAAEQEIGRVREDRMLLAIVRRVSELMAFILPQTYTVQIGEQVVGQFKQTPNPFVMKVMVDFESDTGNLLDRRLGIAAAVLMCAVEGKQN